MISESKLYIWRTLFALAHVDNVISPEERVFMKDAIENTGFSKDQIEILKDDMNNPHDILEMFRGITDKQDQIDFFNCANALIWIDGEFHTKEKAALTALKSEYRQLKVAENPEPQNSSSSQKPSALSDIIHELRQVTIDEG